MPQETAGVAIAVVAALAVVDGALDVLVQQLPVIVTVEDDRWHERIVAAVIATAAAGDAVIVVVAAIRMLVIPPPQWQLKDRLEMDAVPDCDGLSKTWMKTGEFGRVKRTVPMTRTV